MGRTLKEYSTVSLKAEDLEGKIDFARIFGRNGPVHIEVGGGKGTFVVNQAISQPETNFLGIEWARKYYRYAVDRIGRWGLKNVRIIRTDAARFLSEFVPDNSVECFHIYFPDPWPKKRHHKRRFLCQANFEQMLRCLVPKGRVQIATDYLEYFEQIQEVVCSYGEKVEEVGFVPTAGAKKGELVGTNYERKYLKEDREVYTIAIRKK